MFLKEKIKQRVGTLRFTMFLLNIYLLKVIFHGNDVNSLHKYLPKRILPKQYGGTAGDLFELNGMLFFI